MAQFRKTEKRNAAGDFEACKFEELKEGDVFKLMEEDDGGDRSLGTFQATSDATPAEPEGNFGIACKPAK